MSKNGWWYLYWWAYLNWRIVSKELLDGAKNCDSADDGGACGAYGAGDNDGGVDGGVGEDGQKDQMSRCCIASGHHL